MGCAGEGRRSVAGCALRRRALSAALVAFAVSLVAAGSASAFTAQGSVNQVYATGLPANGEASLLNKSGATVYTQNADSQGGLLVRNVKPAAGYRVRLTSNGETSVWVTVPTAAGAPWNPAVYNQSIADNGYQYLTTRDGTQLALTVHPPTSPAGQPGAPSQFHFPEFPAATGYAPPYPTLIEYSGYGYANPAGPESGIAVLANLMGFAVVDVNMRGTGCSGGAYDFFEPLQNLDGYDVIETIAHQPWVLGHKVGMMGISYGAISQLFTAQLDPPDLEAISPLPTIDTTATTLHPVAHFTGPNQKWFPFTKGAHVDSLDPSPYGRWYDFLELFVAHKAPIVNQAATRVAAPPIYQAAMGVNDPVLLPLDPIRTIPA